MFCSKCGSKLDSGDSFCGSCGTKNEQQLNNSNTSENKTPTIKEETGNVQKTWRLFFIIVAVVLFLQSKSIYDVLNESNDIAGAIGQVMGGVFLAIIITMILNKFIFNKKNKQ